MPRYITRTCYVEAVEYRGTLQGLPPSFTSKMDEGMVEGLDGSGRTACMVATPIGPRVAEFGDMLVLGREGVSLMNAAAFEAAYEQVEEEVDHEAGPGVPVVWMGDGDPECPRRMEWNGVSFVLGRPVGVTDPAFVRVLKANRHFDVGEEEVMGEVEGNLLTEPVFEERRGPGRPRKAA